MGCREGCRHYSVVGGTQDTGYREGRASSRTDGAACAEVRRQQEQVGLLWGCLLDPQVCHSRHWPALRPTPSSINAPLHLYTSLLSLHLKSEHITATGYPCSPLLACTGSLFFQKATSACGGLTT